MQTVAQRLMSLFQGLENVSGTHGTPEKDPDGLKWNIKRTAKTTRVPVSLELWEKHLSGQRPLGVVPIRGDNSCSWGSIDFDEYDVDILKIVALAETTKLPLVPCRSKSGGLHLFLFLERPEPAAEVQAALRDAAASLGLAECEIFPKQTQILEGRNDAGSWMVMPYYGGDFEGRLKMQHGLKKTGAEMTVSEFVTHAERRKTTVSAFSRLCEKRRETKSTASPRRKGATGGTPPRGDFADGPPCLQHLASQGFQRDGRKRSLFMFALYFKRADPDHWKDRLESANQKHFSPPLPSSEVAGVISSCDKKDYEYTCKEEPMKSHCNSSLCRTRKFGVGRGGDYPVISGMSKLLTDPPIWFVTVESERLEVSTDELQNYPKFHKVCMSQINKCFKPVRQDVWFQLVSDAMDNLEFIEAPPDVGAGGRFRELLEEFLTDRARGERRDDLLSGRPWEDPEEQRHYFTLRSLQRYLIQEGLRDMTRGQMLVQIKDHLGGGSRFFNFKNQRGLHTQWVPSSAVQKIAELDPPRIKEGEEI